LGHQVHTSWFLLVFIIIIVTVIVVAAILYSGSKTFDKKTIEFNWVYESCRKFNRLIRNISLQVFQFIIKKIDLGQYKDKNNYYHSFKTLFGGRPEDKIESRVVLTIDPYQHNDTNDYYYSLKPYLEVNPEQGLGHEPGWLTWVDPK